MKKILTLISLISIPGLAFSQSVTSAYTISQQDLRGTARYVSMGGAFGALGGDLTAITQNPGGIGIYRSNDIGFSLGLDMNAVKSETVGSSYNDEMTKFNLNNAGAVFTLKLYNDAVPNLNLGFVYNKNAAFNRRYKGYVPSLTNSMSNYIAGLTNAYGLNEADLSFGTNYDPYNPPSNAPAIPWLAVMGYYGFLTTPEGNEENPNWYGQFGNGTSGSGYFSVYEKGSIDDFNIILGGNIDNKLYIGMNFDITSLDYRISSMWGEALQNAYVFNPNVGTNGAVGRYDAQWALYDNYRLSGTGFKFNMGVIFKPIQELRLGFAFHTPTFYNLNETYYDAHLDFNYPFKTQYTSEWANDGYSASNSINFKTPWRIIASAAAVLGNNLIVSADYEWAGYKSMSYSEADYYNYYDPWYDWDYPYGDWGWGWYAPQKSNVRRANDYYYQTPNDYANSIIKEVYSNTSTLRLGAEFRVLSSLSLRAGYCHSSSPVTTKAKNMQVEIPGTGVMTNYTLDDDTNYITFGLGFKAKGFYADLAYVYKRQTAEYFPYSVDVYDVARSTKSKLAINNNSLTLTLGYKF